MNSGNVFAKARGSKRITVGGKYYYDFSSSDLALGHSNKVLTHRLKNIIHIQWNIHDSTIWHRRLLKMIHHYYPGYQVACFGSLIEMFYYLFDHSSLSISSITGKRFEQYLKTIMKPQSFNTLEKGVQLIDMTENYLENLSLEIPQTAILNYYWYPEITADYPRADFVILPALFTPYSKEVLFLYREDAGFSSEMFTIEQTLNSYQCALSVIFVSTLQKQAKLADDFLQFNHPSLLQKGRIFSFKNTDENSLKNWSDFLTKMPFYFNLTPPFYQFIPYILKDHEINHIRRLMNEFGLD